MSLRSVTVFTINANLLWEDGEVSYFPFKIYAKDYYSAEKSLEKYLKKNKKDTGLKYKEVVGFKAESSDKIIMDISENNLVEIFKE